MSVIKDDYVYAAVVGAAFGGVVGGKGDGVGETGDLEAPFLNAEVGEVMENAYCTGRGKFPVGFPGTGGIDINGVGVAFYPEFSTGQFVGDEVGPQAEQYVPGRLNVDPGAGGVKKSVRGKGNYDTPLVVGNAHLVGADLR